MEIPQPASVAGLALALLAAFAFASQYVCVRIATENGRVDDVVFVSLGCNVALIVPATVVLYAPTFGLTPVSLLAFAGAGLTGSLLARLCMFQSVDAIGASRTSPVVSTNVLFATLLAVLLLGERLTPIHSAGIVLLVGGAAVISYETATDDPDRSVREVGVSLALPFLAAGFLGVEPILLSIGFAEGTPVLVSFAVKVLVATAGFLAYLRFRDAVPTTELLEGPERRWYLGAGVASTVGIGAYLAALSIAPVVYVVPFLQTAPLIVVVLSALFLPRRLERVTPRLVAAATVVVGGAVVVSLSG